MGGDPLMQRYYIDSDTFIIYAREDSRLSRNVERILDGYENLIYISSESVRETINLFQCGGIRCKRWKVTQDILDFINDEPRFEIRYWKAEHLQTLVNLPVFDDHRDPFDRLIIAHAITEKLPLISGDTKFPRYVRYGLELIQNIH